MNMDIVLWIAQIILAIKFISTAFTHGLRQDKDSMRQGIQKMGASTRPVLYGSAAVLLLGSLGLILPAAVKPVAWLAPLAAAVLAVMMLLSIFFHLKCREKPLIFADVILLAISLFVAYGRWVLAPFQ